MDVNNSDNQEITSSHRIAKVFEGKLESDQICPVKDILARFGDKWSIYTVLLLGKNDTLRFSELRNNITGISQRMLTVTLRSLEEDGIVKRSIYAEVPTKVVYELTALGKSLMMQMQQLALWAEDHLGDILIARENYSANSRNV